MSEAVRFKLNWDIVCCSQLLEPAAELCCCTAPPKASPFLQFTAFPQPGCSAALLIFPSPVADVLEDQKGRTQRQMCSHKTDPSVLLRGECVPSVRCWDNCWQGWLRAAGYIFILGYGSDTTGLCLLNMLNPKGSWSITQAVFLTLMP